MYSGRYLLMFALAALSVVLFPGCSDDGGPQPVQMVQLSVDSTGVEICATLDLEAQVVGGESKDVDWYVNGVLGGTSILGTITQTNPATLAAPASIPTPATVTIKAVSHEDITKADSCRVTIQLTVLHVSASLGDDATGTGCITAPFKTITHAMEIADSGMTILAAPGVYDQANGEVFPLRLNGDITLAGEDWTTTVIRGHGEGDSYGAAAYLDGRGSALKRLTLEMGTPVSPAWSIAVYVRGTNALLDSLRLTERANYSIVRIDGADSTTVTNCWFVVTEGNRRARGFEIVFNDQATIVRHCTVSGFHTGLFFNYPSDALVEGCVLEDNNVGVEICCLKDPNSDPNPDLGGGARGSAGGNTIRNNADFGLEHMGTRAIYAKHNTWNNSPPTVGSAVGSDIFIGDTGSVIWE
jgi:hypothetical protein